MEATAPLGGSAGYEVTAPLEATAPLDATANSQAYDEAMMRGTGAYQDEGLITLNVHGGGAHTGIVPEGFEGIDTHILDACPRARLTEEEKLLREVARRRQAEIERRARIFDAKRRTIGVDKEFLDQQVAENAARKKAQAQARKMEDREFMGINRIMQCREKEKKLQVREAEKAAKEYSLQNLHFASRREFDINDPKAVTKSIPERVGDEDARCGPASMQKFNGEDLLREERKRQQAAAMRDVIEQQIFEKEMIRRGDDGGDAAYMANIQAIVNAQNDIEAEDKDLRKEIYRDHKQDILDTMKAHDEKKRLEAEANQELNARELAFHAGDEFLNEQGGIRANGKPDKAGYKGSTKDDRKKVLGMQLAQCDQNAARRAMEGSMDKAHQNHTELTRRQLVMMEREKQRMRRAMAMDVAAHNKGMVAAQKEVPKDAHKNQIHSSFFEQFGVGTR